MKKSLTTDVGLKVMAASLALNCFLILNPVAALAEEDGPKVRLWDTGKTYAQKNPRRDVFKDKDNWVQVPYGKTADYRPKGDLMVEGETFYLFLFDNKDDCVELLPKRGDRRSKINEIYKVHQDNKGVRNFGYGTMWVKIAKNTAEEIIVEHAGRGNQAHQPIVTTYRVLASRPWLEIKPVKLANQQGMYCKSRFCAYVRNDGEDLIMDSKRREYREDLKVPAPPGTIGVINFARRVRKSDCDFMWFMTFPPGAGKHPLTHLGFSADPSAHKEERPRASVPFYAGHGGMFVEDGWEGRPSMGAQYAYLGKGGVFISVLGNPSNWGREDVWRQIKKGQTYKTRFKAPYAGQWKLAARLAGEVETSPHLNMVKDPGAEGEARTRIKGYDMPLGWGLYGGPAEWGVTTDEAHSGKRSVYMKTTGYRKGWGKVAAAVCLSPTDGHSGEHAFDAKPNTTYYFSFWVKAKGTKRALSIGPHGWRKPVNKGASIHMFLENLSTKVPVPVRPTEQWRRYEGWFTTAPDTRKMAVFIEIFGGPGQVAAGSTFWIDDVFLGPMVEKKPPSYIHSRVKVEAGQPFTFRSPSDGKLDYILMYLWDRTAETPKSVWTPMDVYRKAVQGTRR